METKIGLSDFAAQQKIDKSLDDINDLTLQLEIFAANQALGIILPRIFNRGQDANGNQIGKYSEKFSIRLKKEDIDRINKLAQRRLKSAGAESKTMRYKDLRTIAGRQTDYVDLQMTDRLFNSIRVVTDGNSAVLGITDQNRAMVAEYLENNLYKKPIFSLGASERKEVIDATREFMFDRLREIINKHWK